MPRGSETFMEHRKECPVYNIPRGKTYEDSICTCKPTKEAPEKCKQCGNDKESWPLGCGKCTYTQQKPGEGDLSKWWIMKISDLLAQQQATLKERVMKAKPTEMISVVNFSNKRERMAFEHGYQSGIHDYEQNILKAFN